MGSELARRGADVVLVASDLSLATRRYSRRSGPWDLRPKTESMGSVRFVWLSAGNYQSNDWHRLLSMVVFGGGTFTYLVQRRYVKRSVIIGSSPHLFAALGAWMAASVRGIPFVLEVRDLWPESYTAVTGRDSDLAVKLLRSLSDFLYRRAAAIVVLAEANGRLISKRGVDPTRIHFIPNGVDPSRFVSTDRSVEEKGLVTFIYLGAHGPANGLDILVGACADLQERGCTGLRVIMVGDGPSKERLLVLAEDLNLKNLEFHDAVPSERVPSVLKMADVGLMLLARADLFSYGVSPNKLFDYFAAALPVLNNVPGVVEETIQRADAGRTCPPGDATALASAMVAMADELRSRPGLYGGGRRFVEEHHDRTLLAGRLEDVLMGVVSSIGAPDGRRGRLDSLQLRLRGRAQRQEC